MENKEKILQTLKDFGRLPKSRIGAIVGMHPDKAEKLLHKLLLENKVVCYKETLSTYWECSEKEKLE